MNNLALISVIGFFWGTGLACRHSWQISSVFEIELKTFKLGEILEHGHCPAVYLVNDQTIK